MKIKNNFLMVALVILCILSIFFAISSSGRLRKVEVDFNEKKATLVKENLDLKDRLDSFQETVAKSALLEKEKSAIEADLKLLKEENEKIKDAYSKLELNNSALVSSKEDLLRQIEELEKKNIDLAKKLTQRESKVAATQIKEERAVALAPIVVKGAQQERIGKVLLVDVKNSLLVINLGSKDETKKGDRCMILKDEKEIASGTIINVRYRESAVFIEDLQYGNKIGDIKEGFAVLVKKEI